MAEELMIEVEDLTKRYGGRTAIDGLTFTVGRGEIVGFLGPNGAGKSTTMRILAGYMPGTSGTARVAGLDVFTQVDDVRRRIGYMPESNPLHLEMRVREYLKFRARLKGLGVRESRRRVDEVTERFGLTQVQGRVIGQLSKGYKQRVGLADALVHEPQLLILDEPTIGLDPHQIRSMRHLIKDLSENHTVLISSHILPEVEMTCGRVIIIHEGRILASDSPENLQNSISESGQIIAEIAAEASAIAAVWEQAPEVAAFDISPGAGAYHHCTLTPRPGEDLRALVFVQAREHGWELRELTRNRHSLEDIFMHITRPDREEEPV